VEEALEVVCQRHQRPFRADILKAAQAEASEAERLFDDAEYWLNGLLAQGVQSLSESLCVGHNLRGKRNDPEETEEK
jgi:hypothetical protein